MEVVTDSAEETKKFAVKIVKKYSKKFNVFALIGELGAGKTTFVQGFAQGLGIRDKIISPTFVLIRQHSIPKINKTLYHIDLYRLEGSISQKELGLDEILENQGNIVLIEWAEKLTGLDKVVSVKMEKISEHKRKIFLKKQSL